MLELYSFRICITKKRRWLKAAHPAGTIVIDEGALKALDPQVFAACGCEGYQGPIHKGEVIQIVCKDETVAKGIPNYSSRISTASKGSIARR